MLDDHLDVFAPNEFEQLQTCRVQEVVTGHCIEEYLQDWFEQFMLDDLAVVRLIVKAEDSAEVLESG
jgi:hypothetical protein